MVMNLHVGTFLSSCTILGFSRRALSSSKLVSYVWCSLMLFESRVLRRTCGPKKDEVTGVWKKTA
jgi:hypothetical protein